jgi:gamma-glutamyltranspeptidase/glutathione hydrolase
MGRALRAPGSAVTAPHELASAAGLRALAAGGTAIDASIAMAAVLSVVYPHMCGIGGDGFWLVADPTDVAHDGRVRVRGLNASGRAAASARLAEYRGRASYIPWRGPLAALTVPGAVDGWWLAYRHSVDAWGSTLRWADLLAPAIGYAAGGYPCTASQTRWTAAGLAPDDVARGALGRFPEWARVFLAADGRAPETGRVLRNPDLAGTLALVAAGGREAFYRGAVATALAAGLAEAGSPLTADDFAAHTSEWVEPLRLAWRGHEVHALPPNSQGLAALQILGLAEAAGVGETADGSADRVHLLTEATRLAFADRDRFVADPAVAPAPLDRLLDAEYLAARGRLIQASKVLVQVKPGIGPAGRAPVGVADGDTAWFGAVDQAGRMASVIQSLYFDFGSAVVPQGTGVVMQNRGAGFRLDPDHPNALAPGKRPFHTLCPLLLTRDGAPAGVLGTMGGEGQPQTCAMLLLRMIKDGLDPQAAVDAPRWLYGRTWGAATLALTLEGGLDGLAPELRRRGHPVQGAPAGADLMGHAGVILVDSQGVRVAAADPRGDGAALGF